MIYRFEVTRLKTSYNFKDDMSAPDSWEGDHNAKRNMEDYGALYRDDVLLWHAPMQTVANMPGVRHSDTIIPGQFFIKWDVPRRAFKGHIHGIVGAIDQDGQQIDEYEHRFSAGRIQRHGEWRATHHFPPPHLGHEHSGGGRSSQLRRQRCPGAGLHGDHAGQRHGAFRGRLDL